MNKNKSGENGLNNGKVSEKHGKTLLGDKRPYVGEVIGRTYAYHPPLERSDAIGENEDIVDYLARTSYRLIYVRIMPGYGIQGQ